MTGRLSKPKHRPKWWSRTATAVDPRSLIPHIRALSASLATCDSSQLQMETEGIRSEIAKGAELTSPDVLVAGISLTSEALRRSLSVNLYDAQLAAVIQLSWGHIAQMQTGEGKTFAAIATAGHLALAGRGVHVMTPNTYLAERDGDTARAVLSELGMTVGITPEQGETLPKRQAYDCDVTYGTGHEFGFDYLRDQLTLRQEAAATLGTRLLQDLFANGPGQRTTMQRGLAYAIVDEADSVLIDDAGSPLVLSMATPGEAPDLRAHATAMLVAEVLTADEHYTLDATTAAVRLTPNGMNRCYENDIEVPADVLLRPWTAYVEQALRAKFIFRRNVHFVVVEGEARIVDETTGRIFEDRSWQDGLHQAIEMREGLKVTPEKESLARITRQRFFRLYQNLCGMTGTAIGCESEFQHVYRSQVVEISLRVLSQRSIFPTRFFASLAHKHAAVVDTIRERHANRQPVLVGTQSITDSEAIAARLETAGLHYEMLNGLQTAEEAQIVSQAGQLSAITISTNLAGRGTDISVPPDALEVRGLHVIVAECQLSGRMDRQLVGRCARQGSPGSAQAFVSAEDPLLKRFGQWLSNAIQREADSTGEASADFTRPLMRLQRVAEKQQFRGRVELLRQDISRDTLFGTIARD